MKRTKSLGWSAVSALCLVACSAEPGSNGAGVMDPGAGMPSATTDVVPVDGTNPSMPTSGATTDASGNPIDPTAPNGAGGGDSMMMPDAMPTSTSPGPIPPPDCNTLNPGRAPLRRLTRFEYNNTLADLLHDDSSPGDALPPEQSGNGFGNNADQQPISDFLVEQYGVIAEDAALRALAAPDVIAEHLPCLSTVTADTEAGCARSFVESFLPSAYRRPVAPAEVDEMLALQEEVRALDTFESSLAAVIEAALQTPDFLYRVEFGEPNPTDSSVLRLTGAEMATRLSYLFWGTMPDAALEAAASSGELSTPEGVMAHAARMLDDDESRPVVRFFFDHFLPINTLTDLSRDAEQYPTFSPTIGSLMHQETQTFLEQEIFSGPGDWPSILTAPYTYVNEQLAEFYGIENVTGPDFRQVPLDTTKRLGLMTQGAIMAGTTISNFTNPVRRGVFVLEHMMCQHLPPPPESFAAEIMPPDPYSGATGRERYSLHLVPPEGVDPASHPCPTCHAVMDPPGFALENFDAVGLWRDQENGVTIDASGEIPSLEGPFNGPVELVQKVAASEAAQNCLAENWLTFAYGRALDASDECTQASVETAFAESGYNVKQLLLALTQTDAFLYMSATQE